MRTLNLGILAHVDAGKTTLTERLLYAAGVIDEPGSVDAGTTQTDSLALERRRGITIKAAVVSFVIDDLTVNIIDTPGHPDFIAEVDRALGVLDGAILVLSAVEGVQPQTRVLMRALQRLQVPALLFVNKIDRAGANRERVLAAITQRLTRAIVPMGTTSRIGTRAAAFEPGLPPDATLAEILAEHDDAMLDAYVDGATRVARTRLRSALAAQARHGRVYPVFFGSAITGAGVDALIDGIAGYLPATAATGTDGDRETAATVFKIERGSKGEKIAYVRMFAGRLSVRDRVDTGAATRHKVTALRVFEHGGAIPRDHVNAGEIAMVWGWHDVRVGDHIGPAPAKAAQPHFAPPTMEAAVIARDPDDGTRLRRALGQLAEQDPLINVRDEGARHELSVSLYGEVQKEVLGAMLADDFGIDVTFAETTTLYIERVATTAEALELLQDDANPYSATVGLRIAPGSPGSGIVFRLDVDHRDVPAHIYKNADNFVASMAQYVEQALTVGRYGWPVTDCIVTMFASGYYASDGPRKPNLPTPRTTAADFRKLTPRCAARCPGPGHDRRVRTDDTRAHRMPERLRRRSPRIDRPARRRGPGTGARR